MSGANVGVNVWNQRAVGQIKIDTTGSGKSDISVGVNSLNSLDVKTGNSADTVYLSGKIGNGITSPESGVSQCVQMSPCVLLTKGDPRENML